MKRLLILSTLILAGCGVTDQSYTKDLGAVTIRVEENKTVATLDQGYIFAKIKWTAKGNISGEDNITPSTSPDTLGLGYKQNIEVEVTEYY